MALTGEEQTQFAVKIKIATDPKGTATVKFSAPSQQVTFPSGKELTFNSGNFNVDQDLNLVVNSEGVFTLDYTVETSWSNGKLRHGSFVVNISAGSGDTGYEVINIEAGVCHGIPLIGYGRTPSVDLVGYAWAAAIAMPADPPFLVKNNTIFSGDTSRVEYTHPAQLLTNDPPENTLPIPTFPYGSSDPSLAYNTSLGGTAFLSIISVRSITRLSGGASNYTPYELAANVGNLLGAANKAGGQIITPSDPSTPFKLIIQITGVIEAYILESKQFLNSDSSPKAPAETTRSATSSTLDIAFFSKTTGEKLANILGGVSLGPMTSENKQLLFFNSFTVELENMIPVGIDLDDWFIGVEISGSPGAVAIPTPWPSVSELGAFGGYIDIRDTHQILITNLATSYAIGTEVFDYETQSLVTLAVATSGRMVYNVTTVVDEVPNPCKLEYSVTIGDPIVENISFEANGWKDEYTGDETYIVHFEVTTNNYSRIRLERTSPTGTPAYTGTVRVSVYSDDTYSTLISFVDLSPNTGQEINLAPTQPTVYVTVRPHPAIPPTPTNGLINFRFNYAIGAHPNNPWQLGNVQLSGNIVETIFDPNNKMYIEWTPTVGGGTPYELQTVDSTGTNIDTILRYHGLDGTYITVVESDDDGGTPAGYSLIGNFVPAGVGVVNFISVENKGAVHNINRFFRVQSIQSCFLQGNGPGEISSNPKTFGVTSANIDAGVITTLDIADALVADTDAIFVRVDINEDFTVGYSDLLFNFSIAGETFTVENYGADSTFTTLVSSHGPLSTLVGVTYTPAPASGSRYFKLIPSGDWECSTVLFSLSGTATGSFACNGPGDSSGNTWDLSVNAVDFSSCGVEGNLLVEDALCADTDAIFIRITIQDDPSLYAGDLHIGFEDVQTFMDLEAEFYGSDSSFSSLVDADQGGFPQITISQGSLSQFDELYFKILPDPFGSGTWQSGSEITMCPDSF